MERKRITIDLDVGLLRKLDDSAQRQRVSRNRFILNSVKRALAKLERRRVDSEFASMANDPEYCRDLVSLEKELQFESERAWGLMDRREADN